MIINIRNQECELKYSFNSFMYMENFDISVLDTIENKPFAIVPMLQILVLGAVNHNPMVRYNLNDVQAFLEKYIEEESVTELLEYLMQELQKSNFFKSLQKKTK